MSCPAGITVCSVCGAPTHASESDELDRCPACHVVPLFDETLGMRPLTMRDLIHLSGFGATIDHDAGAMAEHRRRVISGMNDSMPNPFESAGPRTRNLPERPDLVWVSPPCEYFTKGDRKP